MNQNSFPKLPSEYKPRGCRDQDSKVKAGEKGFEFNNFKPRSQNRPLKCQYCKTEHAV
jgi:hypothetical protein